MVTPDRPFQIFEQKNSKIKFQTVHSSRSNDKMHSEKRITRNESWEQEYGEDSIVAMGTAHIGEKINFHSFHIKLFINLCK